MTANLQRIDPNRRAGIYEFSVHKSLYNTLVNYDLKGNLVPELAASWDSSDAKTFTFNLRDDVKWHDGKDFTAEDVDATFSRILDPDLGARKDQRIFVELIESRGPVDKYTYEFTFKQPSMVAIHQLMKLPIVRADFNDESPIGTGPFRFIEWAKDEHLKVEKFEEYWKPGLPAVDGINYTFVLDPQQQINKIVTGEVDVLVTFPLSQIETLEKAEGVNLHFLPQDVNPDFYFFLMRTDQPPYDDVKVRQAINWAIDREALLQIAPGYAGVMSNPVPRGFWAFNPNAISYDKRDLDQAKQLMDEAGMGSGFSTTLKYWTEWAENAMIAQIVQANLAEISIDVELVLVELGVYVEQVYTNHDYELSMTALVPLYDPEDMLATVAYRYDAIALRWEDEEYLALLDEGNTSVDQEVRKEAFGKAQEIWMREVPGAVLNQTPVRLAARDNVKNISPTSGTYAEYEGVTLG
jgi:peptide/nickel transport system substrate-binding protein